LLERGVPCTRALHFPYREAASSARGMRPAFVQGHGVVREEPTTLGQGN
jgi:hypothetical protein